MDILSTPSERIKVFISSAQAPEKGFSWEDVRRRIKEKLQKCPYLNPFIIEDVCSELPSNQLFEFQVYSADIIVLLVKGEMRLGTRSEFTAAKRYRKSLLVYFLDDPCPDSEVDHLRKTIQKDDLCTYRYMKSFNNVEDFIFENVIENIITSYRFQHFQTLQSELPASGPMEELLPAVNLDYMPTKKSLGWFQSCYSYLLDILGIWYHKEKKPAEQSDLHHFGVFAIDWLVLGESLESQEMIVQFINQVKTKGDIATDYLPERWQAIRYGLQGKYENAAAILQEAKASAESKKAPSWIINDMLIDIRNFEYSQGASQREFFPRSEAQQKIEQLESILNMPVLDRYSKEIFENIYKEEFRVETASPTSVLIGSGLDQAITLLLNYFFSAILYGSYTHMCVSRTMLAQILYMYAKIYDNPGMMIRSIKLYLIAGEEKKVKEILTSQWDHLYLDLIKEADALWKCSKLCAPLLQDALRQLVASKLGLYLSDQAFSEVEEYLLQFSPKVYWGNSEDYFECILANISRISPEHTVEMILDIIIQKKFHMGRKISLIIMQLEMAKISVVTQEKLRDALQEQIPFIMDNNGIPQMISALEQENPEVFSCLAKIPDNHLVDLEKEYYEIHVGRGDWSKILFLTFQMAKDQFAKNRQPEFHAEFAYEPYRTISSIIRNSPEENRNFVYEQFLPFATEVIRSTADVGTKGNCIACLCEIVSAFKMTATDIPPEMQEAICNFSLSKEKGIEKVFLGTPTTLAYRILTLKTLLELSEPEEFLDWCVEYTHKQTIERRVLIECIELFLKGQAAKIKEKQFIALSIVLQSFGDEDSSVRIKSCDCLVHFLDTEYHEIAEQRLYDATFDSSHWVRNHVLALCKDGKISNIAFRSHLLESLSKDSNYAIRRYAMEAMTAEESAACN